MLKREIPGETEWAGYEQDLDATYAFRLFSGKSTHEVLEHFSHGRGIERASELRFMPRKAFQYYIFAFAEYLRSPGAAGDSDAASPFLRLLLERERRDPGSVAEVFPELAPTIDFVAVNQSYFEADPTIYGSLSEQADAIRSAVKAVGTSSCQATGG